MKIASRVATVAQSATVAMAARAQAMMAAGVDVAAFNVGEPDFDVPPHVVDATVAALRAGRTRYAPVAGVPALRVAAARWLSERYGVSIAAGDVAVTVGGKQAIYNALQTLVDAGDEVLVPSPYWVSYPAQVALAGGRAVTVPMAAEAGFALDVGRLEAAITARTVGVIVNSPNNPTGAVYDAAALAALADLAVARDLWILSDDIYSELVYDGVWTSVLHGRPELRERVVLVHGVAKTYAMTGYRVGFLVAPPAVLSRALVVQGQATTGATTFAMDGAVAALEGDHGFLDAWREAYDRRRRLIVGLLDGIVGVSCAAPAGAFYVFPDVRGVLGRRYAGEIVGTDVRLAELLLEEAHVAVVPGSAFGAPGFLRLSYACDERTITDGIGRVADLVARLDA